MGAGSAAAASEQERGSVEMEEEGRVHLVLEMAAVAAGVAAAGWTAAGSRREPAVAATAAA